MGNLRSSTARTGALSAGFFVVCAVLAPVSAAEFAAHKLAVRDITADIRITTRTSDDIDVTIEQGKEFQRIRVIHDEENDRVILQGDGWNDPEGGCCDNRITRDVTVAADTAQRRADEKSGDAAAARQRAFAKYPTITVAMPRDGDIDFDDVRMLINLDDLDGAVEMDACFAYGEIGNIDEAAIGIVSGSRLVVGDVRSDLELDLSGDADIRLGNAGAVDVDVSGSGEAVFNTIDGMLDVSIAGSGLVRAARLDGPLTTRIAGSGDVYIGAGRADPLKAIIQGSGSVTVEAPVGGTDLRLSRSAVARLGAVSGRVNKSGSGQVFVGGKLIGGE